MLGLSLLLGTIIVFDLRVIGLWRSMPVSRLAPVLLGPAKAGFLIAAVSGGLLFTARAADYLTNPLMLVKLCLLIVALLNIGLARHSYAWQRALEDQPIQRSVKLSAVVSLSAWIGVMFAGRLIGYR